MSVYENNELTPREYVLMENERDENRLIREHAVTIKQLELAVKKEDNAARIELKRLESKWSSLLKIPITIVKLPIFMVLGIAYCIASARKYDPPKKFWELLQ